MQKKFIYTMFVLLMLARPALGQNDGQAPRTFDSLAKSVTPTELVTYKKIGDTELKLHVFRPEGTSAKDRLPTFVVIHGGGWRSNNAMRFYPFAASVRDKGYLTMSIEYRLVSDKSGTSVFDCVKDARAAVRYVRKHAEELGVDPHRITVGGGSAGAHLAFACAAFDGIDHEDEDLTVSCRPDGVVLFYGVLDTSPEGYGNALIGEQWQSISPRHQIRPGLPPMLIFHGDKDDVAKLPILKDFCERLAANKVPYELILKEGGAHGHIIKDMAQFDDAIDLTARFMAKIVKPAKGRE